MSSSKPKSSHIVSTGLAIQLAFTITSPYIFLVIKYFDNVPEFRWNYVLEILFVGLWITFGIMTLKIRTAFKDKKKKTPMLEKCERDYTIGCMGLILFAIIPLTLIGFCGFSMLNCIRIYFISSIQSTVLYFTFIYPIEKQCELRYRTSYFTICLVVFLVTIVPGLVWRIFTNLHHGWIVVLVGGTYSTTLICSMITLMSIASHQLRLTKKKEVFYGKELKEVKTYPKPSAPELPDEKDEVRCSVIDETSSGEIQKKSTCPECEICMQKYDASIENRAPRILIKCGHTMCHGCLLRVQIHNRIIFCPFCQQMTTVNEGKVENLPKNFAILKMI